jgi:hypothetical protein
LVDLSTGCKNLQKSKMVIHHILGDEADGEAAGADVQEHAGAALLCRVIRWVEHGFRQVRGGKASVVRSGNSLEWRLLKMEHDRVD